MHPEVLIIGAGNIAQGFDSPDATSVRTHIKGYRHYAPFFNVQAFFDIDADKAHDAAETWSVPFFSSDFSEIESRRFDVVSICTPDSTHGYYLEKVLAMQPKVIFLEKPLGISASQAHEVFRYCNDNQILLLLNYSRLYINEFNTLRKQIQSPDFGDILSVSIKYHKGFFHNCSHFISLVLFLIDPVYCSAAVTGVINDYEGDPSWSALVSFEGQKGKFRMNIEAYDQAVIHFIEVDIIGSNRRVIYRESMGAQVTEYKKLGYFDGMFLQEFVEDKNYRIDYNLAMINAVDVIRKYLTGVEKPDAFYQPLFVNTVAIMENIAQSGLSNQFI